MTTGWTNDELRAIGAAQELEVQPARPDGTFDKPVTIWVVRQGDDLYVRSWLGPRAAWFRGVQDRHEGRIRAGGVERDVTLVDVAEKPVNAAIDVAYRAKYGNSRYATAMVTEPARSTTIRLLPR
jgi:hypothetical protein